MPAPPHNSQAEAAVLGAVLLDNLALKQISPWLDAVDFFSENHRRVYEAMLSLSVKKTPIDITTLSAELSDGLEKIGGLVAIDSLSGAVATMANVESYAKIVADLAMARRILCAGQEIVHLARRNLDVSEIKSEASDLLKGAMVSEKGSSIAVSASDCIDSACDEAISREPITGVVRTMLGKLDTDFGGLHPGIPYLLAARTSMGKSTVALNIVINACLAGRRVIYHTYEESRKILLWRMMSKLAQVNLFRIFNRRLSGEERTELRAAADIIRTHNLTIIDRSMSSQRICDHAEMENDREKVDLVIVDLITKVSEDPRMKMYEATSKTSNTLSQLPGLIDAPVLAVHQINRKVESNDSVDKMPMLSHLRESGKLEEDFKTIMFLLRPAYYDRTGQADKHEMAMRIVKNANGPVGNLPLWCDLPRMTIRAPAESEEY